MNKLLPILAILFVWLSFSACEKVIEFDLSGSKEMIVIEAILNNGKGPITVLVSKTSPYFGTKTDNTVSGAKVSIRMEGKNPIYLNETKPGIYQIENTRAESGYWYIVDVESEGITYSARSYMNHLVPITDLSFSYSDGLGVFKSGYLVHCYINDPGDQENYYQLKYFVNGKPTDNQGELTLYSDKLFNGKEIGLGQRSSVFNENDTLTIELQSIDKAAYDYFSTLENITGNELVQSASPANPTGNFNNGALGYFSAYSYIRRTLIIKDYIQN